MLVVVLTGGIRVVDEAGGIGAVRDLIFDTSYGTTLVVKVALVAGLIGLGALNRRRSIPRLASGEHLLVPRHDGRSGRGRPRPGRDRAAHRPQP